MFIYFNQTKHPTPCVVFLTNTKAQNAILRRVSYREQQMYTG